ncbi:RidA family protein [Luteitalea pratensis]|nr:RidA family protein [Luteitalea pratensis]
MSDGWRSITVCRTKSGSYAALAALAAVLLLAAPVLSQPAPRPLPTPPRPAAPRQVTPEPAPPAAPAPAVRRTVTPTGAPTGRPYSPGVMVGQSLYISGQLGLPGTGATPAAMDLQARQAMDGVGAVLKAAGLGFEHLVKCHVYLANMDDYVAMNAAYASYFTERVPARTTVQAVALPSTAGIEVSCIAYSDLAGITVVHPPAGSLPTPLGPYSPAVWAGDTLYLSGMGGQDPATKTVSDAVEGQVTQTVANVTTTLKAAGLSLTDAVAVQAYATRGDEATALASSLTDALGRAQGSPARGLVVLPRLPGQIRAELTFVAVKPAVARRTTMQQMNDVSAESTQVGPVLYAAPRPGATGDDVTTQARAAFRALQQSVKMAGFDWRDVAVVHVYLTDIADLPRTNTVFAELFPTDPPARVTIQVHPQGKERIRLGLVAAK